MTSLLWFLSILWAIVYGVRSCISLPTSSRFRSRDVLPVSATGTGGGGGTRRSSFLKLKSRFSALQLQISVRNFHLEVRTSALNGLHDSCIAFWGGRVRSSSSPFSPTTTSFSPAYAYADGEGEGKEEESRIKSKIKSLVRRSLCTFYDIGIGFAVFGILLGVGVLVYTSVGFVLSKVVVLRRGEGDGRGRIFERRDVDVGVGVGVSGTGIGAVGDSGFVVNAIIPGVTVPWSHLPFILVALFFSQCFHEAGHAIAGALEGLTLHSVGASLTVVIPSAFVSFSSSMDTLSVLARLRVIASGAWHNLVLWAVLYLMSFSAVSFWNTLGWRDVGRIGVVVVEVDETSPLVHHLHPGDLITGLDDASLGSIEVLSEELWSRYLLAPKIPDQQGWCIDLDTFSNQTTSCCDTNGAREPTHPPAAQLTCFVPLRDTGQGHCIDPFPMMVSSPSQRCFSASDCDDHTMPDTSKGHSNKCVQPDTSTELLRIEVAPPVWESEGGAIDIHRNRVRTVLWSGPKKEVWEQVKAGMLAPLHAFLPLWLPSSVSIFFSYLSTLSLSLYIFNLFALPFLDGGHFLSALLDFLGDSRNRDPFGNEGEPDIELGAGTVGRAMFREFRTNSPSILARLSHSCAKALRLWTWGWRRRIRRHKVNIERVVRYGTIVFMGMTVLGMAWPS